ncbi:MAG: NTP transferase domain-containing protein [Patescibacteria group bacterium]
MEKIKIIILAAGKGTRMKSDLPKALAPLNRKPMIEHLRASIAQVIEGKPIVVIGHQAELVKSTLGDNFIYVIQHEQLGTAHALLSAKDACGDTERILVLYGDHPYVSAQTIKKLLKKSEETGAVITMASSIIPDFENERKVFLNFAKIFRVNDEITGIREKTDAIDQEQDAKEVNPGYYVFRSPWVWESLKKINKQNTQGEYYLTDLLKIAIQDGQKIESVLIEPREAMGANSKEELDILEKLEK